VRIGVVLPNWIGDLVMATPALRALRRQFPAARIVGVAQPYLVSLLDGTPWLDEIFGCQHRGRGRIGRVWQLGKQLRAEKLDQLLLLRSSLSAALIGRLSGAKRIVGYARGAQSWLLTDAIAASHFGRGATPISAVDQYANLLAVLGYQVTSRQLELRTTRANEHAADALWKRLALPAGDRVMVLHAGGAYGQAKHWPTEYCVSLALRAAEEFGLTTLVSCGPEDREAAAAIEHSAHHPQVRSLAREQSNFGLTKAMIRRSRLVVTTDSGPRHIAAALRTPTVVLFGPNDPRWSHNYHQESIELRVELDCSPCGRRICPLGHHRCMRDLTVDQVLKAVAAILGSTRGTRRAA